MKLFFLIICSLFVFSSCQNKYEVYLRNNTSEIRKCIFVGECEDFECSLILGEREKNYIVNGYSGDCVEFGIISFDFQEKESLESGNFALTVGTEKISGDLKINPIDNTLVADIKKTFDCDKKVYAKICMGKYEKELQLKCVNNNWKVQSEDVYNILSQKLKKEVSSFVASNTFEGEVYIKILNDKDINVSDYYWFVNIIGRNGNRLSAIISPQTKEILALNDLT